MGTLLFYPITVIINEGSNVTLDLCLKMTFIKCVKCDIFYIYSWIHSFFFSIYVLLNKKFILTKRTRLLLPACICFDLVFSKHVELIVYRSIIYWI